MRELNLEEQKNVHGGNAKACAAAGLHAAIGSITITMTSGNPPGAAAASAAYGAAVAGACFVAEAT